MPCLSIHRQHFVSLGVSQPLACWNDAPRLFQMSVETSASVSLGPLLSHVFAAQCHDQINWGSFLRLRQWYIQDHPMNPGTGHARWNKDRMWIAKKDMIQLTQGTYIGQPASSTPRVLSGSKTGRRGWTQEGDGRGTCCMYPWLGVLPAYIMQMPGVWGFSLGVKSRHNRYLYGGLWLTLSREAAISNIDINRI